MKVNEVIIDPFGRKLEGFWKSTKYPKYPMPVANQIDQETADEIFNLIKKAEKKASKTQYRGMAQSRIDKSWVGSGEFQKDGWIWPAGFAEHYVKKYRVKPSDEFLEFIGFLK